MYFVNYGKENFNRVIDGRWTTRQQLNFYWSGSWSEAFW